MRAFGISGQAAMEQDADRAQSVRMWMQLYTPPLKAPTTTVGTLRSILELAFPSAFRSACDQLTQAHESDADWSVVSQVLETFYERPLKINQQNLLLQQTAELQQIMELTLVAIVQSEKKETFVRDILTLPDAVQADLMAIIEAGMSFSASVDVQSPRYSESKEADAVNADDKGFMKVHEPKDHVGSSSPSFAILRSPLYLSRNAELERTKRENDVLKHDNIHLARDLQGVMEELKQSENTRQMMEEEIRRVQMQSETDTVKQERVIRSLFDQKLQALQRDLDAANKELYQHRTIEKEARRLRDEVDLLSPTVKKVTKLEAALAKYKAKVEELPTLKEKLKRVEDINDDLVAKNLLLETQVTKAASLQRKLTEAKEVNTAVEFCVSELKSQISRQTNELNHLRSDLEATQISLQEAKDLNDQLQDSTKHNGTLDTSDTVECSHSVASGIGDLNPELTQKLARLTHENQELRKQVNNETSERISSLVDEAEDMKRLKCSYETKYFDIEQQLKASDDELAETRTIVCDRDQSLKILEAEKKQLIAARAALKSALQEATDKISELSVEIKTLKNEIEERIQKELTSNARVCHFKNTTQVQQSTIGDLQKNVNILRNHQWMLQEDIHGYSEERARIVEERSKLRSQMNDLQCLQEYTKAQLDQISKRCKDLEDQVLEKANSVKNTTLMLENERELNTINANKAEEVLRQTNERYIDELKCLDQEHERMMLKAKHDHKQTISDYENRIRDMENTQSACIARMTDTIDMKANMIEKLKEELQQSIDQHQNDIDTLRIKHSRQTEELAEETLTVRTELANYIEMHSVSDADWTTKEQSMRELAETQIQQLQTSNNSMRLSFERQKNELRQQIKNQIDANCHMSKLKQTLETELANARATITHLEHSVTRLESKAVLLERERAHFSSEEEKKRDVEDEQSAHSTRVSAQTALVVAELEKLHEEHKALQQERRNCQCDLPNMARRSSLGESKKDGQQLYSSQVRQLEYAKQQEEAKRRELMLVNTKLLQEQKQLQIKNNSLSNETQQLKDKINGSLLRDERRKKEMNRLRHEIESLRNTIQLQSTPEEVQQSSHPIDHDSLPADSATERTQTEVDKDIFTPNKKRKKKHVVETISSMETVQSHPSEGSQPKRRMPLIYRNKTQSEKEDSASECKQQSSQPAAAFVNMSDPTSAAPKRPSPPPLTLEEKLWFDRRKKELQQYAGMGGGLGAAVCTAITSFGPFNRRTQLLTILGGAVIGGGSGYLYADSKALERINDLSATSRLRKEVQKLNLERKR